MIKRLKKLARSGQWQLLYNRAKEISNLKLFDNAGDLSLIQSYFLYYLELYSSLYGDLYLYKIIFLLILIFFIS